MANEDVKDQEPELDDRSLEDVSGGTEEDNNNNINNS